MGKRLVTRPLGHFLGKHLRLSTECCCLRQIIWLRIIEILAKRLCFLLPCLLHRHPPERECLQRSARVHIESSSNKTGKSKHISLQNQPFIVVTSCPITTHNHHPRPRSPHPQSQAHHTTTSHINTPTLADITQSQQHETRHRGDILLNSGSSIGKASQKPWMYDLLMENKGSRERKLLPSHSCRRSWSRRR